MTDYTRYKSISERKAYEKKYYEEHKEERAAYAKKYREEHKEEKAAYGKKYRAENKERCAKMKKDWYEENKHTKKYIANRKNYREERRNNGLQAEYDKKRRNEKGEELRAMARKWYKENKEKVAIKTKIWRDSHKELQATRGKIYRAKVKEKAPFKHGVYFIQDENNRTKIGNSDNFTERLRKFQTASPEKLTLFAYIKTPSKQLAEIAEKLIQDHFKKDCIRGEWYNISAKRIKMYAKSNKLNLNYG